MIHLIIAGAKVKTTPAHLPPADLARLAADGACPPGNAAATARRADAAIDVGARRSGQSVRGYADCRQVPRTFVFGDRHAAPESGDAVVSHSG